MELFECLDAVERDAAGALDRERQPVLFDRLSWFRLLQMHCPPPGNLLVARARDGSGKRSWLFLSVEGRRALPFANWYTLRFATIREGDRDEKLDHAIADALRRRGIASIELHPLGNPARHSASYVRGGWKTVAETTGANWQADVAGKSFDDFWSARPARLRNTAERKARAANLDISVHSRFDPQAWSAYEDVYTASWKPEEGSPAFLRALAEQEGAAGTLRLGIAREEGCPIAAQFWLVENGHATIHKLAHREDARHSSPGTLLSLALFRHVIDVDRVQRIDFGLGDEPYKAEWMDRKAPVGRMIAYNPRTLPGLAGAGRAMASMLVRRLRNN